MNGLMSKKVTIPSKLTSPSKTLVLLSVVTEKLPIRMFAESAGAGEIETEWIGEIVNHVYGVYKVERSHSVNRYCKRTIVER